MPTYRLQQKEHGRQSFWRCKLITTSYRFKQTFSFPCMRFTLARMFLSPEGNTFLSFICFLFLCDWCSRFWFRSLCFCFQEKIFSFFFHLQHVNFIFKFGKMAYNWISIFSDTVNPSDAIMLPATLSFNRKIGAFFVCGCRKSFNRLCHYFCNIVWHCNNRESIEGHASQWIALMLWMLWMRMVKKKESKWKYCRQQYLV